MRMPTKENFKKYLIEVLHWTDKIAENWCNYLISIGELKKEEN